MDLHETSNSIIEEVKDKIIEEICKNETDPLEINQLYNELNADLR